VFQDIDELSSVNFLFIFFPSWIMLLYHPDPSQERTTFDLAAIHEVFGKCVVVAGNQLGGIIFK